MSLLRLSQILTNYKFDKVTLLPMQVAHLEKYGAPSYDSYMMDNIDEFEIPWYKLFYIIANTFGEHDARIDLNDIADLADISKRHAVRDVLNLFEGEVESKEIKKDGAGRPETRYYLTLQQANLYMMTGTTERCKKLRIFFSKMLTLSAQFGKMHSVYSTQQQSLTYASARMIEDNKENNGIFFAHDTSDNEEKGIPLIVGITSNIEETMNNLGGNVVLLKFYRSDVTEFVMNNLKEILEIKRRSKKITKDIMTIFLKDEEMASMVISVVERSVKVFSEMGKLKMQLEITQANLAIVQVENAKLNTIMELLKHGISATENTQGNDNFVKQFIERCTKEDTDSTTLKGMYEIYKKWYYVQRKSQSELSIKDFENELVKNKVFVSKNISCKYPTPAVQKGVLGRSFVQGIQRNLVLP